MKKSLLVLMIANFISINVIACSCEWGGNFIKAVPLSDLIIKGKVIKRIYHSEDGKRYLDYNKFSEAHLQNNFSDFYGIGESIKVDIVEIIKGKENRRIIEVFDTDGADCRESISRFKVNDVYVFAVYRPMRKGKRLPNETDKDYALGSCYESYLRYFSNTDNVFGAIKGKSLNKKRRFYNYQKLKKKIQCQL